MDSKTMKSYLVLRIRDADLLEWLSGNKLCCVWLEAAFETQREMVDYVETFQEIENETGSHLFPTFLSDIELEKIIA